jgi:hypothetical protein
VSRAFDRSPLTMLVSAQTPMRWERVIPLSAAPPARHSFGLVPADEYMYVVQGSAVPPQPSAQCEASTLRLHLATGTFLFIFSLVRLVLMCV